MTSANTASTGTTNAMSCGIRPTAKDQNVDKKLEKEYEEDVNFDDHLQNHMHVRKTDADEHLKEHQRTNSIESIVRYLHRKVSKPMLNEVKASRRGGRRPGSGNNKSNPAADDEDPCDLPKMNAEFSNLKGLAMQKKQKNASASSAGRAMLGR